MGFSYFAKPKPSSKLHLDLGLPYSHILLPNTPTRDSIKLDLYICINHSKYKLETQVQNTRYRYRFKIQAADKNKLKIQVGDKG